VNRTGGQETGWSGQPVILVADGDRLSRDFLRDLLASAGYLVRVVGSGSQVLRRIRHDPPDLLLLDTHLPDVNGLAVLHQVRKTAGGQHLPVILITEPSGKTEMVKGFETGADDFLVKPVSQVELMARVKGHLRAKTYQDALEGEKQDLASVLEMSKAVTSALPSEETFQIIVERTARLVDAPRCSLVVIRQHDQQGLVLASSQAPFRKFRLDLPQYPEIIQAVRERRQVVIQDVDSDPLMAPVRDKMRTLGFRSLLVLPISLRDSVVGTLVLCTARATSPFSERHVRTCQFVAEVAANALRNAHIFENLELDQVDLQRFALEDERLGVYHLHVFRRRLEDEVARASRHRHPVSCVAIGPDPGGAQEPETLLRDLALFVKANLRKTDLLSHTSGHLLLMLPVTPPEGARLKADRLRSAIQGQDLGGAPAGSVTISLGVASGVPNGRVGAADLVRASLAALQEAQSAGGNAVIVHPLSC
jgi:two-component system cell cycle response regulator